jgi:hypothetical protein
MLKNNNKKNLTNYVHKFRFFLCGKDFKLYCPYIYRKIEVDKAFNSDYKFSV